MRDEVCLDDDTMTALLERRLDAAAMRRVDAHLDRCADCRALVATLADDVSSVAPPGAPSAELERDTVVAPHAIPPGVSARLGTVIHGKWTLESLLGAGGMAAVFKGRHRIGRVDAIKIVHPELARDKEARARFEREARAVNRLRHAGAVAIRDIDTTEDGAPFLVMEFLVGEPLSAWSHRPIDTERLLRVMVTVLDVLADAHALGVVHRDVKPANIFVLADGGAKLLDFGMARLRDVGERSIFTRAGQTLGTLAYMPPEQLRGEGVDHRADIFAVGATLFRMLSGRHVHIGTSSADTLVRIATEPAPSLADVAPGAPLALCSVVDRALAFAPSDRYPDAEVMRDDLRALLAGEEPSFASTWRAEPEDADAEARELVGRTVGGHRLVRLIARGGMGAVYEGVGDSGSVAVKVILAEMLERGRDARARFRREIRAASRIDSPHVVRAIDAGIDDATGLPFYSMELVDGRDLAQWLDELGPLAPETVAQLFAMACRGLRAAADVGIVHRDVKPANIMLTDNGAGELVVKLCDFGLAKSVAGELGDESQSLTQSGGMLGTPRYAAPEQATRAAEVDGRADIWGLCLSMHEALSGRRPWASAGTMGQLIVAICTEDMPDLRDVAPWVNPRFAALVRNGLRRDRDERTADLAALERELMALAGDRPLTLACMRRADEGERPDVADITREDAPVNLSDVTMARSRVESAPASVAPARRVSMVALAALAVGGLGWAVGSNVWGEPAAGAQTTAAPTPSSEPPASRSSGGVSASAPTADDAAIPIASNVSPAPATSASGVGMRPVAPTASARPVVVAPSRSATPSPPRPAAPKPGGLDFRKTW